MSEKEKKSLAENDLIRLKMLDEHGRNWAIPESPSEATHVGKVTHIIRDRRGRPASVTLSVEQQIVTTYQRPGKKDRVGHSVETYNVTIPVAAALKNLCDEAERARLTKEPKQRTVEPVKAEDIVEVVDEEEKPTVTVREKKSKGEELPAKDSDSGNAKGAVPASGATP